MQRSATDSIDDDLLDAAVNLLTLDEAATEGADLDDNEERCDAADRALLNYFHVARLAGLDLPGGFGYLASIATKLAAGAVLMPRPDEFRTVARRPARRHLSIVSDS